jgi:hypothetical protein
MTHLASQETPTTGRVPPLTAGSLVFVGSEASVQFGGGRAFAFRVIRMRDWPTYDGWVWIDGYQLDGFGDAVARRDIFVKLAGLRAVSPNPPAARRR